MIEIRKLKNSRGDHYGFNYYFEGGIEKGNGIIIPLPEVTPNKRSVNDIGWMVSGDGVMVYGTLSAHPEENDGANALWQELSPTEDVNKVCSALKFENTGESNVRVVVRVIMC